VYADDTIVAMSSAVGVAGRIIVRLSGADAPSILENFGVPRGEHASARRAELRFDGVACPAWVYQFESPGSYTGEDLIELHLPGNPVLARMVVDWATRHGARPAEPGEFTARAYFRGKLDLSQAEGVAAAIAAQNREQLAASRQLMAGELATRLRPDLETLAESLALLEAGIDFSDEGIEFISLRDLLGRFEGVIGHLETLARESVRFEKLTHEPAIVLAGRANAGKSTLTNALSGQNRSVVSPVSGTTRDALSVEIVLRRGIARLIDAAGIESEISGEIDRQMREMALAAIERADVLVLVRDSTDGRGEIQLTRLPDIRVASKCDLGTPGWSDYLAVSAVRGEGMDELREKMDRVAFGSDSAGARLALSGRHVRLLEEAVETLRRAPAAKDSIELLAAEVRGAIDALGEILGIVTPDDILGRVFSRFCIGK
jgi:tRNA modification GTPase